MNKDLRERLEWLAYRCDDPRVTPDVQDDVKYALEYIDNRNNIINELEKWLVEWREMLDCPDFYEEGIIDCINDTLIKLQELKGSVENETCNQEDNK